MNRKNQNRLVAGVILSSALLIYLWSYPLSQGWIEVNSGLLVYSLESGNRSVECPKDPCRLRIKAGEVELKIKKEGYFPKIEKVVVKRLATKRLSLVMKQIPGLEESITAPAIPERPKRIPSEVESRKPIGIAWTIDGQKLAFWDPNESRLNEWTAKNGIQPIVFIKGVRESLNLVWSPDAKKLVAFAGNEWYWIDTQEFSRKKGVLDFIPSNPVWSPHGGMVWVNGPGQSVMELRPDRPEPEKIGSRMDLVKGIWLPDGAWVYYETVAEGNKTTIYRFDPATNQNEEVVSRFDFPVETIAVDQEGAVFLLDSNKKQWYRLRF